METEFLIALLNNIQGHILVLDKNSKIIFASNNSLELDNQSENGDSDSLIGSDYIDSFIYKNVAIEDQKKIASEIQKVITGKEKDFECHIEIKDPTSRRWFDLKIKGFDYRAQKCALIQYNEITSNKLAEDSLKESEEKFRDAFNSMTDVFSRRSLEGKIEILSPSIYNLTGYTVEEAIGHNIAEYYVDPRQAETLKQKLFKFGDVQNAEVEIQKKDRSIITISVNAKVLYDSEGKPTHVDSVFRDVTLQKKSEENLRKSELTFKGIFNTMIDVFSRSDIKGNCLLISPSVLDVMGYTSEEIIGRNYEEFYARPEDWRQLNKKLIETGGIRNILSEVIKKDGSAIIISSNAKVYYDDGKPAGIESVFRDVTVQKKIKEDLEISTMRYQTLSKASFEAIFISEKGVCIEQNSQAEKMFGYTLAEAVGRNGTDWIAPEDRELVINNMMSGYEKPYEVSALRKDGTSFPAQLQGKMMHYSGRDVRVTALRDISDRKQALDNLIRSEEKYRDLVDNSLVGVFTSTLDGQFLFVNEAIVKMFNFDNVEQMLAAGSISLWKEPKQRKLLMAMLQKQGIVTNFETETITHDNQSLYVLFSTKLHGDNISGMVMNITEQKQAELKVLEHQKRLKNLANQLTITEEKVRKQIAVDLHDNVGQMLASIRMQMSRFTDLEENPELTIRMKNISQALLKSIQATREAIFDLSPPQLNEIGIYAAVEDWMKEQIEEKYNIRTSITGEQEKFNLIENTQFLVFRSIKELMMNVVKHAGAKQLWVKFKRNKKILEITVQDDGIGFVYDPDLHKVKGNVYGLFSIQERMFDLGGSITIDSGLDKGTQAKLTIPLVAN